MKVSAHEHIAALSNRTPTHMTCALKSNLATWRRSALAGVQWNPTLCCWQEAEFHFRVLLGIGGARAVRHLAEVGVALDRSDDRGGISSGYWSEGYIKGQLAALRAIERRAKAEGVWCSAMDAQFAEFCRLLMIRAVVGDTSAGFDSARSASSGRRLRLSGRFLGLVPFGALRVLHQVRKRLRK